ncbi:splicing factor, Prp19-binding domain-containing protein [Phycomyces nitens]|nr:splicing factor, Prp19-binding domain-containing protein [Phycomyces nitens]
MASRPQPKQQRPTNPTRRYRAGQVPENYVDDLSDSEESEEEEQQPQQQPRRERKERQQPSVQFAQKEVVTGLKQIEISEKDVASDRRLRRLRQAQEAAGGVEQDDQEEAKNEEEDDEEEQARERLRMKQKALSQQIEREEAESIRAKAENEESEESEEEEESSSEYETDSEEETIKAMPKPMFIPRSHRETVKQQEKLKKEAEDRERRYQQELEERKKQSHDLLAEELKREKEEDMDKDMTVYEDAVDDTDGLDEEAEFEAWKVRELTRIKRDREERIAREKEQEELERRRALPESERLEEDLARAAETRDKEKGQHTFMQKYYHKGAFYQDPESEVLQRDYSAPTVDEVRNKEMLPKVMQVKNFGLAGRTKWTHLTAEDTSSMDDPWNTGSNKKQRRE